MSLLHAVPGIVGQQGSAAPAVPPVATARNATDNGSTGSADATTGSFTPSASSLLIFAGVAVSASATGNDTVSTPTGGSLTYTQVRVVDGTDAPPFTPAGTDYRTNVGVWRAPVGGSPSSMTVTWDPRSSDSGQSWFSLASFDITGHNAGTPIVQSAENTVSAGGGSSQALTVTLPGALTVGNLLVVVFGAESDAVGGFTAPTAGSGKTMTQLYNDTSVYARVGVWVRDIDGTESTTITCSDLGQTVGGGVAIAFEVAHA